MNAIIAMPRMMFWTRNWRLAKICTLISGDDVVRSTTTNATNNAAPSAKHTQTIAFCQPHNDACCRPNTLRATPAAIRARPR